MARSNNFFKNNPGDRIWWLDTSDVEGEFVFSFDKKKTYNLFRDYPEALTQQKKKIFDKENPFWADFFSDRN